MARRPGDELQQLPFPIKLLPPSTKPGKIFSLTLSALSSALIKKKIKFSSYTVEGDSVGSECKVICEDGFLIYEEMRKYLVIYDEAVSHI